jgi:hypothetical protein
MPFWGDNPTTTTSTSMGQYPEWMKKDMLEAQAAYKNLFKHNLGAGYRPYTGMTTAGFTPEQIASQQGLASLVGSQAPLQQEALGLTRGLTSEFTPEQAQKYMSPYLRASLDAQKAAAQRQFEGTKLPQFEAEAVAAGGMSGLGSRAGVQAAELQSGQNRLMADLEATGQQKAYQDAQNLFKSQKEREKQSALAMQNLNKEMFTSAVREQGLLGAVGSDKRDLWQSMLDEAQGKYWEKEEFGRNELNKWYQSLLGNPIWKQPNYATTGTQAGGGAGIGKTAMSLAAMFGGMGGMGGIGKFFGLGKAGGSIGGLASMPQARPYMNYMRRNMGGQVVPPVVYRQTSGRLPRMNVPDLPVTFEHSIPKPLPKGSGRPITLPLELWRKRKEPSVTMIDIDPKTGEKNEVTYPSYQDAFIEAETEIGGPISDLRRKEGLRAIQLNPDRPRLAADKAARKRELENLPYDPERRESIELYGSESGDDTAHPEMAGIAQAYALEPIKSSPSAKISADLTKSGGDAARKKVDGQAAAIAKYATSSKKFNEQFASDMRKDIKSYGDKVEARLGEDPYQRQKFWFTVASACGKKGGNAITCLADGLKEATNNLDLDRKEKNKLLAELDKQRFGLETKIKEHELKGKLKVADLTKDQQKILAGKSQAIHDAVLKAMEAGASFKKAVAAVMKEERKLLEEKRKSGLKPNETRALRKNVKDALNNVASAYFIEGRPIKGEALKYFNNLNTAYQRMWQKGGASLAEPFLNATINRDLDRFKELFKSKKK